MTKAEYTPGPWKADINIGMDRLGVYPETGKAEFPVAWLPEINRHEVNTANACLIAAAPNLLKAAQQADDCLAKLGWPETNWLRSELRAAIIKATRASEDQSNG